jgi:hypothetical protein
MELGLAPFCARIWPPDGNVDFTDDRGHATLFELFSSPRFLDFSVMGFQRDKEKCGKSRCGMMSDSLDSLTLFGLFVS